MKESLKQNGIVWLMWRHLAELAEKYLKKGSSAYFEGKLQTSSYEKEGRKIYTTEVIVEKLSFLSGRSDSSSSMDYNSGNNGNSMGNTNASSTPSDNSYQSMPPAPEDDLPF